MRGDGRFSQRWSHILMIENVALIDLVLFVAWVSLLSICTTALYLVLGASNSSKVETKLDKVHMQTN